MHAINIACFYDVLFYFLVDLFFIPPPNFNERGKMTNAGKRVRCSLGIRFKNTHHNAALFFAGSSSSSSSSSSRRRRRRRAQKSPEFPHAAKKRKEAQLVAGAVVESLRATETAEEIRLEFRDGVGVSGRCVAAAAAAAAASCREDWHREVALQQRRRLAADQLMPLPEADVAEAARPRIGRRVVDEPFQLLEQLPQAEHGCGKRPLGGGRRGGGGGARQLPGLELGRLLRGAGTREHGMVQLEEKSHEIGVGGPSEESRHVGSIVDPFHGRSECVRRIGGQKAQLGPMGMMLGIRKHRWRKRKKKKKRKKRMGEGWELRTNESATRLQVACSTHGSKRIH